MQYRKRVDDFDFDLTVQRFGFSATPGDSLRTFFSSQAAAMKGSQNLAGISDPVIDALIDKIIAADSRESLTMACRALDRVIRSGRYWVPHWYKPAHWLAYWDVRRRNSSSEDSACAARALAGVSASSELGLLSPPRAPGLPGSRLMLRKSGKPDLRWGRDGEGGGAWRKVARQSHDPHPQPLPTRGRGAHRVRR